MLVSSLCGRKRLDPDLTKAVVCLFVDFRSAFPALRLTPSEKIYGNAVSPIVIITTVKVKATITTTANWC